MSKGKGMEGKEMKNAPNLIIPISFATGHWKRGK